MYKNIIEKNKCVGCMLCVNICPVKCIKVYQNKEGFYFPYIESQKCINCKKCLNNCIINNYDFNDFHQIKNAYAVQTKDKNIFFNSASGGFFSSVATYIIKKGGSVCASIDNLKNGQEFIITSNIDDIKKMSGSKYYQAKLDPIIYDTLNEKLKNNFVLFCGTPCQVAAVKKSVPLLLQKNLLLVDIVCQGVPSFRVVKSYRDYIEKKYNDKLIKHIFRSKKNRVGKNYLIELIMSNKNILKVGQEDYYSRAFQYQVNLRESCYNCIYAQNKRVSDITIGDYWGNLDDFFSYNYGITLALCMTEKGDRILKECKLLNSIECDIKENIKDNIPLNHPVKRPLSRSIFYKILNTFGFVFAVRVSCWKYEIKKILKRS